MFEQSIILPEETHKRWTFAASVAMEASAVGVLLLIPLIYTEAIRGQIGPLRIVPPLMRPPVQVILEPRPTAAPRARAHVDFLLPKVVKSIDQIVKMPEIGPAPKLDDCLGCVATNFPASDVGSLLGPGTRDLPPPPARPQTKPAEVVKKAVVEPLRRLEVSQGVLEAKIIRRVLPLYPPLARQARVQGTVSLLGVISKDGTIQHLEVISGHPLLVRAAVEAVKQWLYHPTLLNGQPVEVSAPIEVRFTLSN